MMWETVIFAVIALALLLLLLVLLREPPAGPVAQLKLPPRQPLQIEELFPLHCRHFPRMKHVLQQEDEKYLEHRASKRILRRWRAERRKIALEFLAGLREDFRNLNRLAREVAALSPHLSAGRERELFQLSLRFQALCVLVQWRLRFGFAPLSGLARLTEMVGNLAAGVESAIVSLEESSLTQFRSSHAGFSA